ncbi:MAG: hypothetical protein ACE5JN_12250, partial [Candidatus Methylomirabilia bacterium]
ALAQMSPGHGMAPGTRGGMGAGSGPLMQMHGMMQQMQGMMQGMAEMHKAMAEMMESRTKGKQRKEEADALRR